MIIRVLITIGCLCAVPGCAQLKSAGRSADLRAIPWKWDTTLLNREGWKCDSSQSGDLWKLDDGTIVVHLGGIWEYGYFRDQFIQRTEEIDVCSTDNGVTWSEYTGPPLNNANELPDGTLVEAVTIESISTRVDEMKALVIESLGITDDDLSHCIFGQELWPESKREELETSGYHVESLMSMPGVIGASRDQTLAVKRSFDDGKTWKIKAIDGLPHFASLYIYGTGTVLSDGTVLYAAPGKKNDEDIRGVHVLRLKDKGETWQVSTLAWDPMGAHEYNETDILELPDGRLLALMR